MVSIILSFLDFDSGFLKDQIQIYENIMSYFEHIIFNRNIKANTQMRAQTTEKFQKNNSSGSLLSFVMDTQRYFCYFPKH